MRWPDVREEREGSCGRSAQRFVRSRTHGWCNSSGAVTTQGRLFILGVLQNGDRWDRGRIWAQRMCSTVPELHKDH